MSSDSSDSVKSIADHNDDDSELALINFFGKLKIKTEDNLKPQQTMSLNAGNVELNGSATIVPVPALNSTDLQIIPNFDGNPARLHRFISACESILSRYFDANNLDNFQNVVLLNSILNKIEGRAEEVVAIYGSQSWAVIKNALLQNFGDQRDENSLNLDLVSLKQKGNETPSQFYERVLHRRPH